MRRQPSNLSRTSRLTLECLERRDLLSGSPVAPSSDLIALTWHNQEVKAYAHRWVIGIDGLTGTKAERLTAADQLVRSRSSGPAAGVSRHLGGNSFLVETEATPAWAELRTSLANIKGFKYLEPDLVYQASASPNDTYFDYLDGMHNVAQWDGIYDADIDAPEAWNYTTGSASVVVGVIDSGIDYTHPDLSDNIWTNPGEDWNGYDDDGNGYVDDVYGYDFNENDSDPFDDNHHGTHVAGTIGASGNNGYGVAGVSWQVSIMALRFLDANGNGPLSAAVEAINYATMMRQAGVNIRVTNNSWGGGGYSEALREAIVAHADADILFVAAAGNEGNNNDAAPSYPANYDVANIISVAAVDNKDQLADFSNYGAKTVDLAAPGVDILSTTPYGEFDFLSGTSMATPHVTGVTVLAWSLVPNASFAEMKNAILSSVDPVSQLAGYTSTGGRLNAYGTIATLYNKAEYDGTGFVVGGAPGRVQLRRLGDGALITDFAPFGNGYLGGVTVAMGDVNDDGYDDIAVAAAVGNPHVKVYDGWTIANYFDSGNPDSALLVQLFPFAMQFNVGANLALGDVNGDGMDDLIAGATAGNPHVRVYSGNGLSQGQATLMREFFAFGMQFNVGATVAAGDFNNDGYAEVVTGASTGNPHVKVYNGRSLANGSGAEKALMSQFFAYGLQFNVGVNVATGDTNGDGVSDLITGASIGSPHVKVHDGRKIATGSTGLLTQFFAYSGGQNIGVRVGATDLNGDGRSDILTGASKAMPFFRIVPGNSTGTQPWAMFEEWSSVFGGGVFVGG